MDKSQVKNYLTQQAAKNRALQQQMKAATPDQPIKTNAQIKADLTFIFTVRNLKNELNPYLLFDASGQYNFNTNNSITNEGIEITGEKKNYKAFQNQLIGNSYKIIGVNVEASTPDQLNESVSIYTNSQDNNAAIFQKSITPALYKYSGQFLPNLIESDEDIYLDMFCAWTSKMKPLASFTFKIFASYGKSFR